MGLLDMLNQVLGSGEAGAQQHFDQVAQNAPSDVLATGLASAFRSDQTPPIGDMVGTMFANSNGTQQAGMLNQIIAALGPAVAAGLAGGVLGRAMTPGSTQITPDQASQLSPQDVREVVVHAHETQPGLADELASFYAQHSTLIKTLGGAALAIAMARMKDHVADR
jgi:hypothetical protein